MNIMVFDIETVPDVNAARRLFSLQDLSDEDVAKAVFHKRRQEANTEFLRHHLHQIVAISIVLQTTSGVKVWSLGTEDSDEQDILQRFYDGIERYTPRLVSWNGGGFDLPVIHYRTLQYDINAAHYWETGQNDSSFRYNNYLSRYHDRHTDLMDVLAGFQPRANAPLDQIASLCGFPGKMGMDGSKVWPAYQRGEIKAIRDYCETDVLNTYLVYLRHQLNRGQIDSIRFNQLCDQLKVQLETMDQQHTSDFLSQWISS